MPTPKGYRRRKGAISSASCAAGSFRRVRSGRALVTICCPKGKWDRKRERCKVGTRSTGLDVRPRGFGGSRGRWKTRAAFRLKPGGPWRWITWTHEHGNKHAAIIEKASEIGAVAWDFSQADHGQIDRVNF